jgi:hypothetical protein
MFAVYGGQLEVLKWLRANGYLWSNATCTWAKKGRYPEILKWLRANGGPE